MQCHAVLCYATRATLSYTQCYAVLRCAAQSGARIRNTVQSLAELRSAIVLRDASHSCAVPCRTTQCRHEVLRSANCSYDLSYGYAPTSEQCRAGLSCAVLSYATQSDAGCAKLRRDAECRAGLRCAMLCCTKRRSTTLSYAALRYKVQRCASQKSNA